MAFGGAPDRLPVALLVPGPNGFTVNVVTAALHDKEDVARLTASVAKVRPFILAEGWRPTLLTDRADLSAWIKPKTDQLELFAA